MPHLRDTSAPTSFVSAPYLPATAQTTQGVASGIFGTVVDAISTTATTVSFTTSAISPTLLNIGAGCAIGGGLIGIGITGYGTYKSAATNQQVANTGDRNADTNRLVVDQNAHAVELNAAVNLRNADAAMLTAETNADKWQHEKQNDIQNTAVSQIDQSTPLGSKLAGDDDAPSGSQLSSNLSAPSESINQAPSTRTIPQASPKALCRSRPAPSPSRVPPSQPTRSQREILAGLERAKKHFQKDRKSARPPLAGTNLRIGKEKIALEAQRERNFNRARTALFEKFYGTASPTPPSSSPICDNPGLFTTPNNNRLPLPNATELITNCHDAEGIEHSGGLSDEPNSIDPACFEPEEANLRIFPSIS